MVNGRIKHSVKLDEPKITIKLLILLYYYCTINLRCIFYCNYVFVSSTVKKRVVRCVGCCVVKTDKKV